MTPNLFPLLLTAGATRNPVDAIRYLSAGATGTTALALIDRLLHRKPHRFAPTLLGSEEACLRAAAAKPAHVRACPREVYTSTRDLMARMEAWLHSSPRGVVIHSAAVGDYEIANPNALKIPSGQPQITLTLTPTPKIVDHIRNWAPDCFLVSFKAGSPELTPEELEAIARRQLLRTGSDLVFANVLGRLQTSVLLVSADTTTAFADRGAALDALVAQLPSPR